MDAFERLLKLEDHLLSLQLSPQPDCPPQEPALLLDAIMFDDPLDVGEPIAYAVMINCLHAVSVLPIATPSLSRIAHCKDALFSARLGSTTGRCTD